MANTSELSYEAQGSPGAGAFERESVDLGQKERYLSSWTLDASGQGRLAWAAQSRKIASSSTVSNGDITQWRRNRGKCICPSDTHTTK